MVQKQNRSMSMSWYLAALALVDTIALCIGKCMTLLSMNEREQWSFPTWNINSVNSAKSRNVINHWSKNQGNFKDPVFYMCLAGAAVTRCDRLEPFYCNDKYLVTEFREISENNLGKLNEHKNMSPVA